MSPVKNHVRGIGLTSGEKMQVLNLYKTVSKDNPEICVRDLVDKVAKSIGIGVSSVYRIMKEYKSAGEFKSPVKNKPKTKTIISEADEIVKNAIRRKVHSFYFNKDNPTLDKILSAVNDDPDLPDFKRTTMFHLLKNLGFEYKKRNRNSGL